ncbi:M10 family metallopeptidase [Microvirga solisilvae]|uniref:M10 family metallopeptidase n=1 Tax=Microvirga solisilvae TaxID=2919498 RepID=UPI001FAF8679|nr:M10 family metallopeptidase [Microvirga solisilvae]
MTSTFTVARTGNQDIDGILSSVRWSNSTLTYSFPKQASFYESTYGSGEPHDSFGALNTSQVRAAREVFAMMASVSNLSFTEITETQETHATLRLANADTPPAAWTYLPDTSPEGGDTWFGPTNGWFGNPVRGGYGYYAFMHEMLHGVGLKHGNEDGAFGAMTTARDSMEYSVMTYRSYVGAPGQYVENEEWGYAQSLMMYDILALQHLYGADYTTNSGNTVYKWNPATGQEFINGVGQVAPGGNRIFMTVWDGGGNDTYDFANYKTNLTVDLRPGQWSRLSTTQIAQLGDGQYARGNVANALTYNRDNRSLIENAIGGIGNDVMIGNVIANNLKGGAGADKLYGLQGNDYLSGGSGKDIFVFNTTLSRTSNVDRLLDYSVVDDTIYLENAIFTKIGAVGKLASAAFWAAAKAHDSSDRILYDKALGGLYYDADGTGKAASVAIAQLPKNLSMSAAEFVIV